MNITKKTIMDTAERLFAEQGLQTVSVRKIMQEAKLNLALSHYYFGSKENLIKEVLCRRIIPMNEERLHLLERLENESENNSLTLEDVLSAFFAPVIILIDDCPSFGRLLGHVHMMPDEMIKKFYWELFEEVIDRFTQVFRKVFPAFLTSSQRLCRVYFMMGGMLQIMTSFQEAKELAGARGDEITKEIILSEIIAFTAAGLRADPGCQQVVSE